MLEKDFSDSTEEQALVITNNENAEETFSGSPRIPPTNPSILAGIKSNDEIIYISALMETSLSKKFANDDMKGVCPAPDLIISTDVVAFSNTDGSKKRKGNRRRKGKW
jgi:hypothetical protein